MKTRPPNRLLIQRIQNVLFGNSFMSRNKAQNRIERPNPQKCVIGHWDALMSRRLCFKNDMTVIGTSTPNTSSTRFFSNPSKSVVRTRMRRKAGKRRKKKKRISKRRGASNAPIFSRCTPTTMRSDERPARMCSIRGIKVWSPFANSTR